MELVVRALLEFLGIVERGATRREPVALPAWTRLIPPIAVGVLTLASFLLSLVIRALVG